MRAQSRRPFILALALAITFVGVHGAQQEYLGKFLGKLSELHHGVSGEVYAVDGRTLHIKDFTYDGQGPAAYFFAGNTKSPSKAGFRVRDENGSGDVIRRYRKEGVTITLPEGKSLNNIKWFSVWCEEFEVNFGDIRIPRGFEYPRPQKIERLQGVHGISSDNIVIVDAQTLLVPNLSYDGEAPDAKFWVGRGPKPSPQGIRVSDENGKEVPLRRYDRKTVVLTLPADLTVFDIGHFGIWCEAFTVDFGHVQVPQKLNVPPSLRMLGVSPQSKLNCEILHDDLAFEVRWAVAGDSIVLQLVAKLDDREYMSFGLSGDESRSVMIGGDVAVAWVDRETLKGYAQDYFLDAKSQCSGPKGSCPDTRLAENTDNIRLLNAAMVNGYSIVTYQRPLKASDELDRTIHTNQSQAIIWAIGPLNQRDEVSFHSRYTKGDKYIDFGRPAKWNCPMPEGDHPPMKPSPTTPARIQEEIVTPEPTTTTTTEATRAPSRRRNPDRRRGSESNRRQEPEAQRSTTRNKLAERRSPAKESELTTSSTPRPVPTPAPVSSKNAWEIPPIQCYEPDDGVFYAQMGPTGGKRGYPAITGHVGWGISWYINGLLIPVINVIRGKTYTFVVEGGQNADIPAKYHPFYITDDPIGGYEYKTPEERSKVRIFAGVTQTRDGSVIPTGVGRLCHWTHQGDDDADDYESFGAYQRTLELRCDQGEPGVIEWTPDSNTPDTVYYQCFSHRYLGWKINVVDECDTQPAGSEIIETRLRPEVKVKREQSQYIPEDLQPSQSIKVQSAVKPNGLEQPKSKFPAKQSLEIISDVIQPPPMVVVEQKKPEMTNNRYVKTQALPKPTQSQKFRSPQAKKRPSYTTRPPQQHRRKEAPRPAFKPGFYNRPNYSNSAKKIKITPNHQQMRVKTKPQFTPRRPQILMGNKQKVKVNTVEISPQQASTEREPETFAQKKPYVIQPQKEHYDETMPLAVNTGFHPESVVIEGGFKPILSKEPVRRDEEGPELKYESEIGIIDVSPMNRSQGLSLKDEKRRALVGKTPVYVVVKRGRNEGEDIEVKAEAAERVESYYLPPANQKPKLVLQSKNPSNIDIPPGTVVTYDGKKVSGSSLTVRAHDTSSVLEGHSSRAHEYIRAGPQYAPFKGELPPLDPNVLHGNAPQLHQRTSININRELDTPELPGQSTKLTRVDSGNVRSKRSPHHTPEHTEQQNREEKERQTNGGASFELSKFAPIAMLAIAYWVM